MKSDNIVNNDDRKPESLGRRKAVKTIAGGITAFAAFNMLPTKWGTPIMEQVFLPAHAQTSNADDPNADGTVTAGNVEICVIDSNAIQDDFFDLYVNNVFIGVVNNGPGETTCHNATINPGANTVELRLTAPQGQGTLLSVDINGEFVSEFMGTQDHSWIVNGA